MSLTPWPLRRAMMALEASTVALRGGTRQSVQAECANTCWVCMQNRLACHKTAVTCHETAVTCHETAVTCHETVM